MTRTKTVKTAIVKKVNGYGISRVEERKVDLDDNLYGQILVFYDVCLEEGEGDCIESFKTMKAAEKYCREN